jgi:universal stress protein A
VSKSAETELRTLASREIPAEINGDTLVRHGLPGEEIVETARELPADLIVISTHGRTGLAHVVIGSVAEQVVRHAPCPVLVLRRPRSRA